MLTALDGLSWPTKKLRPGELDYEYDGRAKAFKKAFMDLQTLETTYAHVSICMRKKKALKGSY